MPFSVRLVISSVPHLNEVVFTIVMLINFIVGAFLPVLLEAFPVKVVPLLYNLTPVPQAVAALRIRLLLHRRRLLLLLVLRFRSTT